MTLQNNCFLRNCVQLDTIHWLKHSKSYLMIDDHQRAQHLQFGEWKYQFEYQTEDYWAHLSTLKTLE